MAAHRTEARYGVRQAMVKLRRSTRYRVQDDSVTVRGKGSPKYSGKSVTRRGEEVRDRLGAEAGRYDVGIEGSERESGKSTARDVTGVRPLNPIIDDMPNLR